MAELGPLRGGGATEVQRHQIMPADAVVIGRITSVGLPVESEVIHAFEDLALEVAELLVLPLSQPTLEVDLICPRGRAVIEHLCGAGHGQHSRVMRRFANYQVELVEGQS